MQILTSSGLHPFRVEHLAEALGDDPHEWLAHFLTALEEGRCPRCDGPLMRAEDGMIHPPGDDGSVPAGSLVTACRCIPVCEDCEADEDIFDETWIVYDHPPADVAMPSDWPIDREAMLKTIEEFYGGTRPWVFKPEDAERDGTD